MKRCWRSSVIIVSSCFAVTAALPDGEENTTKLTVFLTDFHLGLNSGYFGMLVAEMIQIRVPPKHVEIFAPVKMVCTRPSTADGHVRAVNKISRRRNP